jgi:3-hydroxyisobutyrate dehydrogenase-like beta-hydroxyacid dehydrogenase
MSAGEMGSGVGRVLHEHGVRVLTCLEGRGARTRERADAAGFVRVPDLETLVREAEIVLSILPPVAAPALADELAAAIRATDADVLVADCNAISPGTVRRIAAVLNGAGARFADAGIIGPPPTRPGNRFFASGAGAVELQHLCQVGLDVRVLDGEVGKASALKMCYAALTKGLQALGTELFVAARLLGVDDVLRAEQARDMGFVVDYLDKAIPTMIPKAYRWVGEMDEIARCFEEVGLPGATFEGFAELYRRVTEADDAPPAEVLERIADTSLLHRHVALFNQGVRSGDFEPMLSQFAEEAEMVFEGVPGGPFHGREAIREAYRRQPPDDQIDLLDVRPSATEIEADYAWRREGGLRAGRLIVRPAGRRIGQLVVTFEPPG